MIINADRFRLGIDLSKTSLMSVSNAKLGRGMIRYLSSGLKLIGGVRVSVPERYEEIVDVALEPNGQVAITADGLTDSRTVTYLLEGFRKSTILVERGTIRDIQHDLATL